MRVLVRAIGKRRPRAGPKGKFSGNRRLRADNPEVIAGGCRVCNVRHKASVVISECAAEAKQRDPFVMLVAYDLLADDGEASAEARQGILLLAEKIAHWIRRESSLKCAAFTEEEAQASIVIHSAASKRQIVFDTVRSGGIVAIRIDEGYRYREQKMELQDTRRLEELMKWLLNRS